MGGNNKEGAKKDAAKVVKGEGFDFGVLKIVAGLLNDTDLPDELINLVKVKEEKLVADFILAMESLEEGITPPKECEDLYEAYVDYVDDQAMVIKFELPEELKPKEEKEEKVTEKKVEKKKTPAKKKAVVKKKAAAKKVEKKKAAPKKKVPAKKKVSAKKKEVRKNEKRLSNIELMKKFIIGKVGGKKIEAEFIKRYEGKGVKIDFIRKRVEIYKGIAEKELNKK